jgi:parallel beta helix pectate lyase-like protein
MKSNLALFCIIGSLLVTPVIVLAADYHVGPGQSYTTIGSVPWYTLAAGDTVYIHYATYHEKFNISTRGTAQNPIRVIGVPDGSGNRPVIDGQNATTSTNNHHRWQTPNIIQWDGVVFIMPNSNDDAPLPGYIEIKNLEIKNGYKTSNFTAENGATLAYEGFAAGIYIRSCQYVTIENCVIHDNGQAIYAWTGAGGNWWDGLASNITIRGNYFYNNGQTGSYTEHQTYLEGLNTIYEYNYYGPQRSGAWGSDLKDRGAGTVIRYNYFDSAPSGWLIDLPEPENGWDALGFSNNEYKQVFIYGNVFVNNGNYSPNYFHWDEDHYAQGTTNPTGQHGRAAIAGGRLFFYNNTVLTIGNQSDFGYAASFHLFNTTYGGYECNPSGARPGIVDVRNNIFAVLPRTAGQPIPIQQFAYCDDQNFNFGVNWVSPGWVTNTSGSVTGLSNIFSPAGNDPGFVNIGTNDLHLTTGSSALNIAGPLAPEVINNYMGLDLTPIAQHVFRQLTEVRSGLTDLGAYQYNPSVPDTAPPTVVNFTMPTTASSLTVAISSFAASDNVGVTGYLITESSTAPAVSSPGWIASAPSSFTFSTAGSKTAYAWAKDAAGNLSASLSASVAITTPFTQLTISDALKVLRASVGLTTLTGSEQINYDVAPLGSNGLPIGNGVINIEDALLILRRSIGIGNW